MSWTDPSWQNGWLVLDRNGNGMIDDLSELFGDQAPQPVSEERNGFRALAVFDERVNGGNLNGAIDPGDSVFTQLRVWIDANQNGISETTELHVLPEAGIFKIGLKYHKSPFVDNYGNRYRYRGTVWGQDKKERDACYDVIIQILFEEGLS